MSKIATTRQNLAFGERLARVRLQEDLSQGEFAKSLDLSLRAYANYERGEREAPLALLWALFEVYGVDPMWMIGGYEDLPVKGKAPMDVGLLVDIAYEIDRRLAGLHRRLKPAARKRLIEVAYAACKGDNQVDGSVLDNLIAIAR